MSYGDELYRDAGMSTGAKVALAVLGVIVAAVILFAAFSAYWYFNSSPEDRLDAQIKGDPASNYIFSPIKQAFPAEYARFQNMLVRDDPWLRNRENIKNQSVAFMKGFITRHAVEAAQAPDAQIENYIEAAAVAGETASHDIAACRALTGAGPSDAAPAHALPIDDNLRMIRAVIDAAAAGRDHPVGRNGPSTQDQAALGRSLVARGVAARDFALLAGRQRNEADQLRGCWAFAQIMGATRALPRQAGVRLAAEMLRQSK